MELILSYLQGITIIFIFLYIYQILWVLYEYFFGTLKGTKKIKKWFIPFLKPIQEYIKITIEIAEN
jgi:succinate dehydrogenase/fumarate reductase cytochrome b subunit